MTFSSAYPASHLHWTEILTLEKNCIIFSEEEKQDVLSKLEFKKIKLGILITAMVQTIYLLHGVATKSILKGQTYCNVLLIRAGVSEKFMWTQL